MKTDKLTNQIALYLLIAFLATAAIGFLIIKPTYANIKSTNAQISEVKFDIASLEQLEKDTEELRRNYESVKEQRNQILSLLPAEAEEERLVAVLNDLAQQSGALMSAFYPEGGNPAANLTSLSIYPAKITVSGTYQNIQNFLKRVEEGARFVDVQGAAVSTGGSNALSTTLTLKAYYQTGVKTTGVQP